MFGFGKKVGPTIGLDINSSTLSVIQLEKTKTDLKVSRFASMLMPPAIVHEGLLADPDAVGLAVRELLDSVGLQKKGPLVQANLAIPGQAVVIRLMPVPKGMPGEELSDVVRQEAINNLPFSIEEANLDWVRVPGTERLDPDGVDREDILLGAIQKNVVDSYWRMAQVAGINLSRLEISSMAAVRGLAFAGMIGQDNMLSLVVNIRQDATDIVLVNKSVPLFSRSVLLGVEAVLDSIARGTNVSPEEALELLPRIQLLGAPTVDPKLGQAAQVARSICSDMTGEVGRSLEFYMSQVGIVNVNQVIVCGPGAAIPEIDQFIANRLNLTTVLANPFQGLVYDRAQILDDRRPFHTALMGLVVDPPTLPSPTVELNLNQSGPEALEYTDERGAEPAEVVATPWFLPALIAGGVFALIAIGVMCYFQYMVIPGQEKEFADFEEQIKISKQKVDSMSQAKVALGQLLERKRALEIVVDHGTPMSILLRCIQENTPQGVRIFSVKVEGKNVVILGSCTDFSRSSHLAINLEGAHVFRTMEPVFVKRLKEHPSQIGFQIAATLADEIYNQIAKNPDAEEKIVSSGASARTKVLDFYASWCPPCQRMKPFMEEAQRKYGSAIEFQPIDIDDQKNAALVSQYQIKSVPDVYFLDSNGLVTDHIKGFSGSGEQIFKACDKLSKLASKTTSK